MKTYILASPKSWHDSLFRSLREKIPGNWVRIIEKQSLTKSYLGQLNPDWVFIPHWSHIISKDVYSNYRCIVFHMTDLPFGRGGSPLQNLIIRSYETTVVSAIRVSKGIDEGPLYLKKPLSLCGTAEEIFIRSAKVIGEMIEEIVENNPEPVSQSGEPVVFTRRKPTESKIAELSTVEQVYNYIRMLDCEGYPHAFLEVGEFRFEFTRASLKSDTSVVADVRIFKK